MFARVYGQKKCALPNCVKTPHQRKLDDSDRNGLANLQTRDLKHSTYS